MSLEPARRIFAAASRPLAGLGLILLVLLGFPVSTGAAAEPPAATAMRLEGDAGRTRFTADLSAAVGYSVYVLSNPYRVVIDLPQVVFSLPPETGQEATGLVRAYRFGPVDEGRARIVLDTDGPALIGKAALLQQEPGQPARLVVDLVRVEEQAFADKLAAGKTVKLPLDPVADWRIEAVHAEAGKYVFRMRDYEKPDEAPTTIHVEPKAEAIHIPEWQRTYVRCMGFQSRS